MSINDPAPTKENINNCVMNAEKMISDLDFRNNLLYGVAEELQLPSICNYDEISLASPISINFKVVLVKLGTEASHKVEFYQNDEGSACLGRAICIPVGNSFCPVILLYDDSDATINHEAIHINQCLKSSYFPLNTQLTQIDRQCLNPSDAVKKVHDQFGLDKALEYTILKPCAILREEAEAWWKVDRKVGKDLAEYFLPNSMISISKFVCAIIDDLKFSANDSRVNELILSLSKNIKQLGFRDRYCEMIVKNYHKVYPKKHDFSQLIALSICTTYEIEDELDLPQTIQVLIDAM